MNIIGISAFYHDSAVALICDGRIVAAAQEERFTRIKHDANFPVNALNYCMKEGGLRPQDIDHVVFFDKPYLKFNRLLHTYLAYAPQGYGSFRRAIPAWLGGKLFQKRKIIRGLQEGLSNPTWSPSLLFAEHHQSHAASAFFPSPFEEAVVLTLDGVGEWSTASVAIGRGNSLTFEKELDFPHSLGMLYSAFTHYIGFRVLSGEYKVMGLAPYGVPQYKDLIIEKMMNLKDDGSFTLDQEYFNYCTGLSMTSERFDALFGQPVRRPDEDLLEQFHMDIAASIQAVTEEIVLRMTRSLAAEYGIKNLCLAGGVALNCVANGKILRDGAFSQVWIQPAAGDAGGALGAALSAYYGMTGAKRIVDGKQDSMQGTYLGPEFEQTDIEARLIKVGAHFKVLDEQALVDETAAALAAGKAVGWFQGRMEFGPRSLGGRSILGDPRSPDMQKTLNLKVKYRESFRPFAPSILREDLGDWFDLDVDSPYMLLVAGVKQQRLRPMTEAENALFGIDKLNVVRSEIPAVTHVDYSARIQTVHSETNPRYHALIKKFKELTGCPVLVNTSFNVRSEPIVCSPEDAFRCLMGTQLDVLSIGNCFLEKTVQDPDLYEDYQNQFDLD